MGDSIPTPTPTTYIQGPAHVRSKRAPHAVPELGLKCPGCGCPLEPYEVFACRIRRLDPPVCLGCLISAVVAFRDDIYPLFEETLGAAGLEDDRGEGP